MKKVLIALFVLVVASAGIAFAGPQTMTDTQMDQVAAGVDQDMYVFTNPAGKYLVVDYDGYLDLITKDKFHIVSGPTTFLDNLGSFISGWNSN